MPKIKAALFDADGVIINAPRLFSHIYAEENGAQPEDFLPFFEGDFKLALEGKADLKDLILKHKDIWSSDQNLELLLEKWFQSENFTDPEPIKLIERFRKEGGKAYLATDQEKYRADYFRTVMFPSTFDQIFVSSELGYRKENPKYWQAVLEKIKDDIPGIEPSEIVYFDDGIRNVEVAKNAGIIAQLYIDVNQAGEAIGY